MSEMIHHGMSGHSKGLEGQCRFCLQSQLSRLQGELDSLKKLNSTLADWNDSLRVTIGDYLIDRANKADLKMALHHWTTRPVNPEWTVDMTKALERAVAERDALKAENERQHGLLELMPFAENTVLKAENEKLLECQKATVEISAGLARDLSLAETERDKFKAALEEIEKMRGMTLLGKCCVNRECISDEEGTACEVRLKAHSAFGQAADVASKALASQGSK